MIGRRIGHRDVGRSAELQRIHEDTGELVDRDLERAVEGSLHEPQLGESVGHRSERRRGHHGIEFRVGEVPLLELTDGIGDLFVVQPVSLLRIALIWSS